MTAAELTGRLRGVKRGTNGWNAAFCPAHDDQRRRSFGFRDGDRGVIVKCHAGCKVEAIAAALGIPVSALFYENGSGGGNAVPSRIIATYDYCDETGAVLLQEVRLEPKAFYQRRPDGRSGWINGIEDVRRVLYRLPELIAAIAARPSGQRIVAIVEGPKDANTLWDLGLPATTNPMGAGKWREEYARQLVAAGAEQVNVFRDNDVPGEEHAITIERSCLAAGLRVRRVRLPGLPPMREKHGEDVTDWLGQGRSREELMGAVNDAPEVTPQDATKPDNSEDSRNSGAKGSAGLRSGTGRGPHVSAVETGLQEAIREIFLDREIPPFDKRRRVADLVMEALRSFGEFCRTDDGRLFLLSKLERRLYDLEQRSFQHLLTNLSGLSATETGFRFVLDILQATTARAARLAQVHTLAWYDPGSGRLAVSDGGGGVWSREPRGDWIYTHNGDDGLLFLTEPEAVPWVPEFGVPGELKWFLDRALFADRPLSRDEHQTLYSVHLLHQFFPALRRTRVIPAFLGGQGSGKTSMMRHTGALLLGKHFEVTGLRRDKEDAFVAAVTGRTLCALDNADSRIPWLDDALATYATGLRYRLRRLYTTNEEVSYAPHAILMLSSRDPHFNRPDVAERLIPLYFERPEKYESEMKLFAALEERRGGIWGDLLGRLAEIADRLPETTGPALPFRMADFAAFGWRVFAPLNQAEEWVRLLSKLESVQAGFSTEGDGLAEALRLMLRRDGDPGTMAVSDLFAKCREIAERDGLPFSRTALSFGQRLSLSKRMLELELGVRIHLERGHERRRWVTITRAGDVGDGGDDRDGKD